MKIMHGDCSEYLKTIKTESIDCIVTSPPYWQLRDYGVSNQIGMEESSRGEQEKAFKELLKEKQEEINKIEDYKKIKFKKEIEENKKIENTINSIYENNIFRAIIVIVTLLCAAIYIIFPRKI